jgi:ribosome-binding factor A
VASTRRVNQVADIIWRELAYVLRRSVADPRLQTVTITGVDVSIDLRHARIFVTMRDMNNRDEMMSGFQKAAPFLRRLLSKSTALRVVPSLHFYFDESIDRGVKLTSLINRLTEKDDDNAENKNEEA